MNSKNAKRQRERRKWSMKNCAMHQRKPDHAQVCCHWNEDVDVA